MKIEIPNNKLVAKCVKVNKMDIKYMSSNKKNLTQREKIKFIINLARDSTILFTPSEQKEICNFNPSKEAITQFKSVFNKTFSQERNKDRLSLIISHLLIKNSKNAEHILPIVLDILIKSKAQVNFNYYYAKSDGILATILFESLSISSISQNKKLSYYKKLLKWISQSSNINNLSFISKRATIYNQKVTFFDFLVTESNRMIRYQDLVCHIICNTEKYNIAISSNFSDLFISFFWSFDDKSNALMFKKIPLLVKKMIKNLPLKIFNQLIIENIQYPFNQKVLNLFLTSLSQRMIQYLFKVRQDVFNNYDLDINALLVNSRVSMSYKKECLLQYSNKIESINNTALYQSIYLSTDSEKEILDFFNFCQKNYTINHSNLYPLVSLNHFLCYFDDDYKSIVSKQLMLNLNLPHEPNIKGAYPLHFLFIYNNWKIKDIKDIEYVINQLRERRVDFNCQTPKGNTPLHIAFKLNRKPELIKILIINGANLNVKNKYGKTPYDYSKSYKHYSNIQEVIDSFYEKEQLDNSIKNDALMIKNKSIKV